MASGEAPSETARTAIPTPANPPGTQPDSHRSPIVGTALWAVGVTILSNVANILKQLKDVTESLTQVLDFARDHIWISAVLLGALMVWGNVLLFRFLYHRLKRRIPTAYQVLVAVGCVAVLVAVFATNLFSLKSLLQDPVQVQEELAGDLATTQAMEG